MRICVRHMLQRQRGDKRDEVCNLDAFPEGAGWWHGGGGLRWAARGRVEGGMEGGETRAVEKLVQREGQG